MDQRTCTLPDCDRTHRARGLCASHYNAAYRKRAEPTPTTCTICGPVPRRRVVAVVKHHIPTVVRFTSAECRWCSACFVQDMRGTGVTARYCSDLCAKRWYRKQWKVTTNRIVSATVRAHVYVRDCGICQLCSKPVDMTLPNSHPMAATLDHIVCQSWTLFPDHTAGNLRLAHRLCNSKRGARAT